MPRKAEVAGQADGPLKWIEGLNRRQFIRLTVVTGTTAALASCGNPENQIVRFIPEEDFVPGVAVWKPSICPLCPAGCGVIARVMDGDAEVFRNGQPGVIRMGLVKKLEGNPRDPISQGKLCARGQAAIQVTYHPDRIANPLKRSGPRGSGQYQDISWDEALAELVTRLDGLAAASQQATLAFLTRPRSGHRLDLIAEFLTRFGAPPPVVFEPFSDDVLRRANRLSFNQEQLPTIDLARSGYVIAFGADFLGTWNSPVAQSAAYGQMRQGRPGVGAKFVQVEARMSQTGANADEWIPARPGTEGVLALGIAHVILAARLRPAGAGSAGAQIDGWSAGLQDYAPAAVEQRTGVKASVIERLARQLVENAPAVAIIGGAPLAQTNGLFHALAVNALNALLGSVGVDGGLRFTPRLNPTTGARRSLSDIVGPGANVQALLVDEANPVFAGPPAWGVRQALEKIPFIASFGSFLDETSVYADLILPDHSFLESWVDARPESGAAAAVASVAGPVMLPLYDTRALPDVLISVGSKLAKPLTPALPASFEEMLHASFDKLGAEAWTTALERGGWSGEPATSGARPPASAAVSPRLAAYAEPQFDGDAGQYPFYFLPHPSPSLLDGSTAHLPWLQELPDPLTTAMWSSWIEINEQTAARLQIAAGDLVEVTSQHGTLRAPAVLSPGVAPDVIAMPAGQGHQTFTRYASGRGANALSIVAPVVEPETGALAWAATRVKISRVGSESDLILFAGATRERPERHGR